MIKLVDLRLAVYDYAEDSSVENHDKLRQVEDECRKEFGDIKTEAAKKACQWVLGDLMKAK